MSRTPRVYVDAPLSPGWSAALPRHSAHHLIDVLRLADGHAIELFNGDGQLYSATLEILGKQAQAKVLTESVAETESPLKICLWQGLSRGERMDASIRQAVELGVSAIRPVTTQRTQIRLDTRRAGKRHEHWSAIIISAAEQSGRAQLPALAPLDSLDNSLRERERDTQGIVMVPGAPESIGSYSAAQTPAKIDLLIGPESGLTETEIEHAICSGFTPLAAGKRILRTETAGPSVISILQARFGDLA